MFDLPQRRELIKKLTDHLGCQHLSDEVVDFLCRQLQTMLSEILQLAEEISFHSARNRISASEINKALLLLGHKEALNLTSRRPLYDSRAAATIRQRRPGLEKEQIDVAQFLSEPLPRPPLGLSFDVHWLAVDGRPALTAENPPYDAMLAAHAQIGERSGAAAAEEEGAPEAKRAPEAADARVSLSSEEQFLIKGILTVVREKDAAEFDTVLDGLRGARSSMDLGAFFCVFLPLLHSEALAAIADAPRLTRVLRVFGALIENPSAPVCDFAHVLLPTLTSVTVHKDTASDELRRDAARLVAEVVNLASVTTPDVGNQVVSLYLSGLSADVPPECRAGAAVGLLGMPARLVGPHILLALVECAESGAADGNAPLAAALSQLVCLIVREFDFPTRPGEDGFSAWLDATELHGVGLARLYALFGRDLRPFLPAPESGSAE